MRWDIDAYNREYLDAEKHMLLFNVALLRHDQPPHFMMLSAVAQTRSFSAGAQFQWSHVWYSLIFPFLSSKAGTVENSRAITQRGSDTYSAGPFTAAISENPTFTFTPIQGQDFASRFESPLTDKLTYFLQDERWGSRDGLEEVANLFADSLRLVHGDPQHCAKGVYEHKRFPFPGNQGYQGLSGCLNYITHESALKYTVIDAVGHQVPTVTPEDTSSSPAATDVIGALQAGYEWIKHDDEAILANPVKLPAWLDYDPKFVPTPTPSPTPSPTAPTAFGTVQVIRPFWGPQSASPPWGSLLYSLPPKYKWWQRRDNGQYVLLPDGYGLDINTPHPTLREEKPAETNDQPAYSDEIVRAVWPAQLDFFYFELRQEASPRLTDPEVEKACVDQKDNDPHVARVICGYIKVAHLLEILRNLAKLACNVPDAPSSQDPVTDCSESIFGVGASAPAWADSSTTYTYIDGDSGVQTSESIWVPAHNPTQNLQLANRDRRTFLLVYKLYQMSLVDTSKLVTSTIPITTISK
jgi:hypothetical protein